MDISFFSFNSIPEDSPISLMDPQKNIKKYYDVESCFEFLKNFQNESTSSVQNDAPMIEHWWKMKWQVSLDYYLSSQSLKEKIQKDHTPKPLRKIDIWLTSAVVQAQCSLIHALIERKTHRKFLPSPISFHVFSTLLLSLEKEIFEGIWNYYVVIFNVEDVPEGVYIYCPTQHGLILVKHGNFREKVVTLLCGMSASMTASFAIIFSLDLEVAQNMLPYERALREIYIDSGRMAQKLLLKGIQHHIGGLPSPAMRDSPMCEFLEINPASCIPLYTLTMGIIPEKFIFSSEQGSS